MIPKYVKIKSWHIWNTWAVSRANRPYKTLCGKHPPIDAPQGGDLPLDEKSCETCLRLDQPKP